MLTRLDGSIVRTENHLLEGDQLTLFASVSKDVLREYGHVTCYQVLEALKLDYTSPRKYRSQR